MSRTYKNSSDVPLDTIIARLHELSDAVVGGRKTQKQEFVMRVPAECDHDADLVLAEAAVRLNALRNYNAELQADLDRAQARLERVRELAEKIRDIAIDSPASNNMQLIYRLACKQAERAGGENA